MCEFMTFVVQRSIPIPVSWKCGPGVKLITGVIMTVIVLQIQQLWSLLPYIRILNQPIVVRPFAHLSTPEPLTKRIVSGPRMVCYVV